MRKSYPSYSLLTLAGLLLAGSCSIIAEVDRTKIPTDGGTTPEGGQGTGGSSTGGMSGTAGKGATGGRAGTGGTGTSGAAGDGSAGDTGGGGDAGAGNTGGTAGTGASGAGAGAGGEGGSGGPVCGDGVIEGAEDCDDGNPPANGDGCSTTCTEESGWGCTGMPSTCTTTCGDGITAGAEVCDDGNGNVCGTCSGNCGTATPSATATGSISPGSAADLLDGETFTLNDGVNSVVFEFDATPGDGVGGTNVAVVFDPAGTATEFQTAIVGAINGVTTGLTITAAAGTAPNVNLVNDVPGKTRNHSSGETVVAAGFTITDMTGGSAHDCGTGLGCKTSADCLNGTCSTSTPHTCN